MCLLALAIEQHADFPLILLANRDEFHARPSTGAAPWSEDERVVGGRDLIAGGSWLGIRADGRLAAVSNVRRAVPVSGKRSRGALVQAFLTGNTSASEFLAQAASRRDDFAPFNLLLGENLRAFALDGVDGSVVTLADGLHCWSNGALTASWPKCRRLKALTVAELRQDDPSPQRMLNLLGDTWQPDDADLPETGVGLQMERFLAPVFVRGRDYGTRCSTVVRFGRTGRIDIWERRFGPNGVLLDSAHFELRAAS